jgi:hypothetical protein
VQLDLIDLGRIFEHVVVAPHKLHGHALLDQAHETVEMVRQRIFCQQWREAPKLPAYNLHRRRLLVLRHEVRGPFIDVSKLVVCEVIGLDTTGNDIGKFARGKGLAKQSPFNIHDS